MSSTTSVGDCDDVYSYRDYPGSKQDPWYEYYQSLGQPLIYYARVQPSSRRYRCGSKKGSPNFFVKAFRWYTQEHHPPGAAQSKTGTPDFASWLDSKYGEYQKEGHMAQNTRSNCQFCGQYEPNVIAARSVSEHREVEPQKSRRRFAIMKRDKKNRWEDGKEYFKRQKKSMGKSSCHKSSNSCEYIMQPIGQISATASEHRRGNIKVVRSDTLGDKKSIMKSPSMTSSRMIDIDYQKSVEIVVTEGAVKERKETCTCTKTEILTIYENTNDSKIINEQFSCKNLVRRLDAECQCSKHSVKTDAQTQYDENMIAPTEKPRIENKPQQKAKIPKNGPPEGISDTSTTHAAKHVTDQNVPHNQVTRTNDVSCHCTFGYKPKNELPPTPTPKSTKESPLLIGNEPNPIPEATPIAMAKTVNEFPCPCRNKIEPVPITEVTRTPVTKTINKLPCSCRAKIEPDPIPVVAPIPNAKAISESPCPCPTKIELNPIPKVAIIPTAKTDNEVLCSCRTENEPVPIPEPAPIPIAKTDKESPCSCPDGNVPGPVSEVSPTPATITCKPSPIETTPTPVHSASALLPTSPTLNECPCTRSFQDAVRTICQQNKACANKQREQILVDPPMVINVLPPRSNSVVTVKSLCGTKNKVNETVQTSDHSICLDDGVIKYPFFMKIVRADRLVIENCTK